MEIINNKLNSLPEQVEENMLNIKKLAQYLKEAYKTSQTLTTSTNTIAISDTNAPTSVVEGWLLDSRGLLFKINGGDTINFLLEFYTDLKGVQGIQGPQGIQGLPGNATIDDNNVSSSPYTWSSKKINDELDIIKNDINYTLLWQNANPDVAFNETHNIDIADLQDYAFIVIAYKVVNSTNNGVAYRKFKLNTSYGSIGSLTFIDNSYLGRGFGTDSATKIYFSNAYASGAQNNNYLIPVAIYGTNIM